MSRAPRKSFRQWIKTSEARLVNSDFVDDARRDSDLPTIKSWAALESYLTIRHNARENCLRCAKKVWEAFEAYRRSPLPLPPA